MPDVTQSKASQAAQYTFNGLVASREFDVIASSRQNARIVLQAYNGVARGAVYVDDQGEVPDTLCYCQRIDVTARVAAPTDGTGLYHVVAFFSRSRGLKIQEPPPDGTVVWGVERQNESRPEDIDVNGAPIENPVGETISPPVSVQRVSRTVVGRWIQWWPDWLTAYAAYAAYEETLNDVAFLGAPRGSLLCLTIEPAEVVNVPVPPGSEYKPYKHEIRLAYHAPIVISSDTYEGWSTIRIAKGTRVKGEIVEGVQKYRDILDENGIPITEPRLLTLDGQELPIGQPPQRMEFRHYLYSHFQNIAALQDA